MTDEKISTPPSFTISGFNPEQTITAAVTIGDDGEIAQIHAENISQWQPIETAPKDGTIIDLWVPGFGRLVDQWWDDGAWSGVVSNSEVSHWMPLPSPPGEE